MAIEIEPGYFGMAQAKALSVEFDSMSEYKGMVDTLLEELTGSNADHKKLADDTLPAAKLGSGFPEADALFKSYDTVITELQKLSKGLAGQIEALGIAVLSAGNGYADVDEETRRRMIVIAKQAQADYVPERDHYLKEQSAAAAAAGSGTGTQTPAANGNTSGGNY